MKVTDLCTYVNRSNRNVWLVKKANFNYVMGF